MQRRSVVKGGLGALLAILTPTLAHGLSKGAATPLRLITFPGTYNILIWAAQEKGFFARAGLAVSHDLTTTSMQLMRDTIAGRYDIAIGSIDNVIAYNNGQGEVAIDRPARLFAFMNILANTQLPLLVQPEIKDFSDLRGKTLAVDALSTGFSFVLRKLLAAHGLTPQDYMLASVGNARDRLAALQARTHAGALLTPPFDRLALAAGLHKLGDSAEILDAYQATCFFARRPWAAAHRQELIAFTRAILASEAWLADPASLDEAGAILAAHVPGMARAQAENAVAGFVAGMSPEMNMPGIANVIALRAEYATPKVELGRPEDYVDLSILHDARR
ncbi:MAG: ABC transporter substrate-binding protein [Pseudomonadota bacterium]